MPRRPACEIDDIINVIRAAKERIVSGSNVTVPSEKVWVDLSNQLNKKVSPKNLYTIVKTNRHNIWQILELCKNTTNVQNKHPNSHSSPETSVLDSTVADSNQQCQCFDIQFEISLSHQKWVEIWPEKVVYKDKSLPTCQREYTILKPGAWTHTLYEEIWKNTKTSCSLRFRRAKIYPNVTSHYLDIIGYCSECDAQPSITAKNMPATNEPVVLQCMICNVDDSLHTGKAKRKLSGDLRTRVSKELWEGRKPAHVWRAAEAYKMMDVGDPEPRHLPNLATLRKAKQEMGDKELGDKDPIMSLHLLKYSVPHNGSIHDIGLDRFFCHYWTPSQMQVYQMNSKPSGSFVSFDATGTVVKRLKKPCGNSGHIFLYQGVLCSQGDHIPVVQMLSENHTIHSIANWLTEWQRAGARVPKEAVCDFSLALLGGLVKAFTPYSDLKTYVNQCFGVLTKKSKDSQLPPCFIRVDVAHCIKLISRWECLRQKGNRVREFYLRAMAQLLQSDLLEDARELIYSIAVVAYSESEGNDGKGIPVVSETCKAQLKRRIAVGALPCVTEDDHSMEPTGIDETLHTDLKMWVTEICEEGQMNAAHHGDRDNLHFLPELVPNIIRMACYLPLWTAVMVPHFKSVHNRASSANVEAEFKNIKHGLFKHESLPIRIDRFVKRHLEFLEGNMRISAAIVKTTEHTETNNRNTEPEADHSERDTGVESSSLEKEPVENWKGLSIPPKKRLSYLNPCSEWLHADTNLKRKRTKINVLKNGNYYAKTPIKVDKMLVSVTNTCAFDSFCQCLCSAFCDSGSFCHYLNKEHKNIEMFDLVKNIVTKGVGKDAYTRRAKMLLETFQYVYLKSGVRQVNGDCNVASIVTSTMTQVPCATITTECSSPYCTGNTKSSRAISLLPVNVDILKSGGMKRLQAALEDGLHLNRSTCLKALKSPQECPDSWKVKDDSSDKLLCNGSVTHGCFTGQLLCIETSADTNHPLSEIPVSIDLDNHLFTLRGVVAFTPGPTRASLGHYVAYCRRTSLGWEKYDDLSERVTTVSAKTKVQPHVILFTKED